MDLVTPNKKVIFPLVLILPKSNGQYTLNADSCDRQVGYIMLQRRWWDNNTRRLLVTEYYRATKNLDTTHGKFLTFVSAVLLLQKY